MELALRELHHRAMFNVFNFSNQPAPSGHPAERRLAGALIAYLSAVLAGVAAVVAFVNAELPVEILTAVI
ncbi:hypothetical protein [Polaromonas sp. A23]|uniref:hypothetical protein n=1 Tax=Polaromonas sp. A23 TaxID=1944133 RepID=UPI0011159518|nr:hypothetical protein [Polaromonas sp. A23]